MILALRPLLAPGLGLLDPVKSGSAVQTSDKTAAPLRSGFSRKRGGKMAKMRTLLGREVIQLKREAKAVRAEIETLEKSAGSNRVEIDRLKGIEQALETARKEALGRFRAAKKKRRVAFDGAKAAVDGTFTELKTRPGADTDAIEKARKTLLGRFAKASIEAGNKKPGDKPKYASEGWLDEAIATAAASLVAAGISAADAKALLGPLQADLKEKHTTIAERQRVVSGDRSAFQATHKKRDRIASRRNKRKKALTGEEAKLQALKPRLQQLTTRIEQVQKVIDRIDAISQGIKVHEKIAEARHLQALDALQENRVADKRKTIERLAEKIESIVHDLRENADDLRSTLRGKRTARVKAEGTVTKLGNQPRTAEQESDFDAALAQLSSLLADEADAQSQLAPAR